MHVQRPYPRRMGRKTLYSREHEALRAVLREARRECGLRQEDLARLLGTRQSFISDIESGQRRVDVVELRHLCQHLGLTLTDFIARWERSLQDDATGG